MMCAKPCPLGWYGGILPQEFTSLGSLLEPKKCQKLAKNKPLSIKKYQLQNSGGGGGGGLLLEGRWKGNPSLHSSVCIL